MLIIFSSSRNKRFNKFGSSFLVSTKIVLVVFAIVLFNLLSCTKLVDVDAPPTSISGGNVYATDATATAVLTGLYATMSSGTSLGNIITGTNSISAQAGLSADELALWSGSTNATFMAQYKNNLSNTLYPSFWTNIYQFIYKVNDAINGVSVSKSLTPAVQNQILGEAKFLRAFFYFYLINMYGDVPLILTTDYKTNATFARTTETLVYQQIIMDLKDAQGLLSDGYVDVSLVNNTTERVRPNKSTAGALLSRVYLYLGQWQNAEDQSTAILNNSLYSLVPLNSVFLKNSQEAIWQLQPVNKGWNTEDAKAFVIMPTGFKLSTPFYINQQLLNAFEPNDKRKSIWLDSILLNVAGIPTRYYYPFKYTKATNGADVTEYLMVFRLGEQYLIRAEARAQLGESNAVDDLNAIRNRAILDNYSGPTDKLTLLGAIMHERQMELFTEWGYRWMDLKRTQTVDQVMTLATPLKGGTWDTNWQLYPIPLNELLRAPYLKQNTGY